MTKKSASRRMRDLQASGKAPAPRASYVAPVHSIHPMFQKKLIEVAQNEEERRKAEGWMPVYDELNAMYVNCAKGVMAPAILSKLAARKDIIAFIRDHASLQLRIEMFKRDIVTLKAELSAIAAEHAGKQGGTADEDEIMAANLIGQKYELFLERLESTIQPSIAHIFEIFTEAEVRMLDAQGKLSENGLKPEQDPAVVTDVSSTEVANTAANAVADINA